MKTIKTYRGQPILEVSKGISAGKETDFGTFRDRLPDRDWSELQRTNMELNKIEDSELTPELKLILLGDLAYMYGSDTVKFEEKLKEFNLL